MLKLATPNANAEVFFINNGNEIIGCGRTELHSPGIVNVIAEVGLIKSSIEDTRACQVLRVENTRLQYSAVDGTYIGTCFSNSADSELRIILQNTRVVDRECFVNGTCPDTFKNVGGYGMALMETSVYKKKTEVPTSVYKKKTEVPKR